MSKTNFSLELKTRFQTVEWPWLLLALRQDELIWKSLDKTELGQQAFELLPAKAEAWSPATIALLALKNPVSLDTLCSLPLQRIGESLLLQASQIYEEWIKKPVAPENLESAGLLAFNFREQYRVSGSWQGILRSEGFDPIAARTSLACLYGMVPQSAGMLRAFLQAKDSRWVKAGIHVLLSNPSLPEVQLATLNSLSAELEPNSILAMLQTLASSRPNLAAILARQVQSTSRGLSLEKLSDGQDPGGFEKLSQTMRTAQIHQIAGRAELAVPELADGLRIVRKMRGYLSAQLARSVAQTKDVTAEGWGNTAREASIEAWKQAVQHAPDEPRYIAGYAGVLIQAGRTTDAAALLKNFIDDASHILHPELMLTYALVLKQMDQPESARHAALKALDLFHNGGVLTETETVTLVSFFLEANDLDSALSAARIGLDIYPVSRDLLALLGKIQFSLNRPDEAAASAYANQAAMACETGLDEKEPQESSEIDIGWHSSAIADSDPEGIQRLLVNSLEAMEAWDAAYEERLVLLKGKENPSRDDLHALAASAAAAQKHEKAIEICRQLLQEQPNDLSLHRLLAESAAAVKDFDTSIEHFNRALQMAPEQGALWRGLVRAQKGAGKEKEAFETLRAASQALPEDAEVQLELGELYLQQGAPTLALPCLKRAHSGDISSDVSERVAYRLGQTLYQLGRMEEARQVLEPVYLLQLDNRPNRIQSAEHEGSAGSFAPELAHSYARTLMALGEPERAVPVLTQVVQDLSADPGACLDLAKALMQLSDQTSGARRALPFLQRLLGIVPDGSSGGYQCLLEDQPRLRAEARALLAEAYAAVGEWEKAMDAFRQALEEPANHDSEMQTRLSLGLGLTALKLDLPEMAVAALQEAAQSEPLNAQIQRSLCDAYISNGLSQDAFQAAKAALDLAPADMDTLVWFIKQGSAITALPGSSSPLVYGEVVQALRTALQQAPERADLLIRLGNILLETGRQSEALEIFRKLASMDIALQKVSLKSLYQAGLDVLAAGDARLAVTLLRKAINQLESTGAADDPLNEGISLADLYEALVKAFERLGDLEGALEAIDHALNLEKARVSLFAAKADILYMLGRFDSARECLEIALQRWPDEVGLLYRSARTLRASGNLPDALRQAEAGISFIEESKETSLKRDLFTIAARLAYATLRPRRAYAYLQKAIPEQDPDFNEYENAILRAEYALEAGEVQAAEQAAIQFEGQASNSPRELAIRGRLAIRNGDRAEADRKCRSAVKMWTKLQMGQPGVTPATSKEAFMAELTSVGMAALENRQWADALSIFRQMVLMFPEEPQAHYLLAQALMICAEAQAICQDFEVVNNAPGPGSLLLQAFQDFENSLNSAAIQAGSADILNPDGVLENWDVEIKRSLGLCSRRGRACFKPILENASALEYLLQTIIPDINDVAALVMVYRRCGAKDRALKSVQVGWHPIFESKDPRSEPLVLVQLALSETDVDKAIGMIKENIARTPADGVGWPELPMLHFLLARLCYQAKNFPAAREAIQKSLSEWPDEPRWQAFAAKIQLAMPNVNRLQQLAEATNYLEKAAAQEPENAAHQLSLGEILLESGQVNRAQQCLEKATRLQPDNADVWFELAKVQHLTGNLDQAGLSADQAIEKSGGQVEALLLRAEIALQANNHRSALSKVETVLREHPDHPQALSFLARALAGLNRPSEALAALDKAIPLLDRPISLQLERLQLVKRSEGLEKGLKALQELVAKNPKQAGYLALLADWLFEAGKRDAAIQAARLALQEGLEGLNIRQRADLHTMIGLHMRKAGQLDQAIQHLSEAIAQSSDHLEAYLELGRVYQERREYQQALKVYQKAINLAGGDYRPYYQAGLVLKDSKDYMAAEAMLRRAAQLAPNEVAVHRLLGAVVALNLVHSHHLVPGDARGD